MKRILLMGNPNVGKSVVFSRLTGVHVVSSNYPGTTVEFTQGAMNLGDDRALLVDAPGIYGLEATCKAEEIALDMIREADAIINVVDATNLERSLHLTLHLLERNLPTAIALNIWDDAKHKGIEINVERLSRELGAPVVPTVAVTGEGIRELVERIREQIESADSPTDSAGDNSPPPERSFYCSACPGKPCCASQSPQIARVRTEEERWSEVGRILSVSQSLQHRHHTFLEIIGDASVHPIMGLPIAAIVLCVSFLAIRLIGEGLIRLVFEPAFNTFWLPVASRIDAALTPNGFLHSVLIGALINGKIDFVQSFGVLTTGIYVAITMVFPYVLAFYLALGILEDFGYLPRLAVLLDTLMHRMGLHGWAVIPMLLGLGCNVPGVMATRVLESPRERMIASTLVSIAIPCASLQAMMWGILGHHGAHYVASVYLVLFIIWIILGRILNLIMRGNSPELILEIPPYRMPSVRTIASKLWMRMTSYFKEAVPFVMLGVLAVNILSYFHAFDYVADAVAPIMTRAFGLPKEAVLALALGFLRKDIAVGMLGALPLSTKQTIISVTLLCMSFPCIATFVVLARELGPKGLIKSTMIMLAASLITGITLNIIL
jgi:ferrous iron transport protein B